LRVQLGTERQDYLATFVEPWFLNRKLQLGVELFHRRLDFVSDEYDEKRTGGRLSLTRALGSDFLIGSVSYTLENVGIINVDKGSTNIFTDSSTGLATTNVNQGASTNIVSEKGYTLVSKIGSSLAYDTRNNVQLPTKGQRTELMAEVASGVLGSDADFYKLELRSAWYFPGFAEGHVWELVGRTGVADAFGDSSNVPIFERWFLGGAYSLRGYKYRHVGPRAADTGEPLGGNTYWFGSAEYSLPIIERVRFALFYDIGNVYADTYDFNFSDYFDNWGLGLRINIPALGPLRLDYGIPISKSGSGRFNFTVGYTRDF
jgi:outer membrane protein insertion porin family